MNNEAMRKLLYNLSFAFYFMICFNYYPSARTHIIVHVFAVLFQVVYQNHVNDVIKMLINHWEVIFSLDEPAGPLYERIVADTV